MSALTYYSLYSVRIFCACLFLVSAVLPINTAQSAQQPTPEQTGTALTPPRKEQDLSGRIADEAAAMIKAAEKEAAAVKDEVLAKASELAKEVVTEATSAATKAATKAAPVAPAVAPIATENETTLEAAAEGAEDVAATQAEHALPESKSASAKYLRTFDISGKRDPFAQMAQENSTQSADTSWWQEAAESAEEEEELDPDELRFDGRRKPNHASYDRLPLIKVTGLMQVGGKRAVSANIQNKGVCILRENDNVVIDGNAKSNLTKWLTIKKIHLNGMTIVLDDGIEITGKFY